MTTTKNQKNNVREPGRTLGMQKYNPRNEKKKSIEELEVKIEENSPNV